MRALPILPALLAALMLAAPALAAPPDPMEDREAREALRLQEAGRFDLSVPLLEAVLVRVPGDPDVLTYLALALRRSGRIAEAEARYAEALTRDANHQPAIAYQGVLFLETGRREMAEANLRRLDALCPQGCAAREDLLREMSARR
jgi:Flp pilus assembly protein TadD